MAFEDEFKEVWKPVKQKKNQSFEDEFNEVWVKPQQQRQQKPSKNEPVLTQTAVNNLKRDFANVPFVTESFKNIQSNQPVNAAVQIKNDIQKKDRPSIVDTLLLNAISGAGDAAKAYANIPVATEKLLMQAIPGEQQLSPGGQRLEQRIKEAEELQLNFDQAQAKAPTAQRVLGNVIRSGVAMAPAIATGTGFGSSPLAFGVQFGSNYAREAENEGSSPLQAAAYGSIMGAVESLSGRFIPDILKNVGGKNAIMGTLKNMGKEGLEEFVSNPLSAIAKRAVYGNDKDPIFNLNRELESFVTGAASAGLFAAGGGAVGKIAAPETVTNIQSNRIQEGQNLAQESVQSEVSMPNTYEQTNALNGQETSFTTNQNIDQEVNRNGLQETQGKAEVNIDGFVSGEVELPESEAELQSILDTIENLPNERKLNLQFFAEKVRKKIDQLRQEYGVMNPGESPRLRDAQIPKKTDAGKTRQFARTAAEILPEESANEVVNEVEQEKFAYTPVSNTESIAKAETEINENYEVAYKKWRGSIDSQKKLTVDDIALGEALITKAAKDGDRQRVGELTVDLAAELTNAGQMVQAARLLKKMSPEGHMLYLQKQIDKVNREMKKRFGDKFDKINMTDEEINSMINAKTTEERDEIALKIASRVARELPSTFMEKFNTWRRIAMLFNPRTHVRNIAGNAIFIPMRKTADIIGSALEKTLKVPESQKTKSVGWSKNSEIVKMVNESWDSVKKTLSNNGRWDIGKVLNREKRIYKNSWLEALNQTSKKTLEAEDLWFLERAYKDSLGQFLAASKLKKVNDAAVNYASQKALKATYRDMSKFANWLNQLKRTNKVAGFFAESLIPFTKTPINVAKRGIEFSPIGLTKGLIDLTRNVKKGKIKASEAIEEMAQGLTGTGAVVLGFLLAKLGLLTGAEDEDIDKANFDRAAGKQPFAIKIEDSYYSWDWAQPVSMPVAMGVQMWEGFRKKKTSMDSVINSLTAGSDSLLNIPLLQTVKRVLVGGYGSDTNSAAEAVLDIAESYVKQAFPTVLGQISRTIDPTIRTTYTAKDNKEASGALGYRINALGNYFASRTPGLSQNLPPKIDTLGNEVRQPDNVAARAALNMLSPGFYSKENKSPVVQEINKVYEQTGDKNIFPRRAPNKLRIGDKVRSLQPKEYVDLQRAIGKRTNEAIGMVLQNPDYQNAVPELKAKVLNDIVNAAYGAAVDEFRAKTNK